MSDILHHELANIISRHQKFYAGEKGCLIKFDIPADRANIELAAETPYDGLDWDTQFEDYYATRLHNAVIKARYRLDSSVGDDYIPACRPNFGMGVHYAMFGGKIIFGGGTSWMEPVIHKASDYPKLEFDMNNIWMQKMAEEMNYYAANGQGVLLSALWGSDGPMDMANGVMGNEIFTELLDNPEDMDRVMEICADACSAMYQMQKEHASKVMGGMISGHANLWIPEPMFGHIGVDASCLTGPALYERFEKNLIESLTDRHGGFMVHTHMIGWRMIDVIANTKGAEILYPALDPNADRIVARLEEILRAIGDRILVIQIFDDNELLRALETLCGRGRVVFLLNAGNRDEALRRMEKINKYYPL